MTGYSAFRIFEETLRIDSSEHFLGLRLNFYIATILAVGGAVWFIRSQRGKPRPSDAQLAHPDAVAGDPVEPESGPAPEASPGPESSSEAAEESPEASESELAKADDT